MAMLDAVKKITSADLFSRDSAGVVNTGVYVGRPFHIDFDRMFVLMADSWKQKANGIPQGSLLLAYYENVETVSEALLFRAIDDAKLPNDDDVIRSMVEYYKDDLKTSGTKTQLDTFTRYEFGFSGTLNAEFWEPSTRTQKARFSSARMSKIIMQRITTA